MEQLRRQQQHFLVVTYPAQGHINPSQHLARRLARSTGARVTFSTAVSAHRRMFPSLSSPDQEFSDGLLSYIPYSDGSDDGIKRSSSNNNKDAAADNPMLRIKQVGTRTLSAVLDRLSARDERVTCVVYTILLPWVADVARAHGVPAVLCWIQPATVLAIYYHYFHGYDGNPRPPSFLATTSEDDPYAAVLDDFRETFDAIERGDDGADAAGGKPTVLVNTFDALEPNALKSVDDLNLIAVGPVIPSLAALEGAAESKDLFAPDEKHYMEWLDGKAEGSVVYVSFGSMSMVKKRQMEEMRKGLKESGRPYLWVVRKDNKEAESIEPEEPDQQGMVVGGAPGAKKGEEREKSTLSPLTSPSPSSPKLNPSLSLSLVEFTYMEQLRRQQQHFLVVTQPAQGHINPSRHLARRLARTTGARVTVSTGISAHRRMFPSLSSHDQEFSDGLLSYIPYDDGSDDGIKRNNNKDTAANSPTLRIKQVGPRTLSAVLDRLSARDERVTCVLYTILLPWVADVARAHGVPAVLCWIQPATALAVYYHYFHGYGGAVAAFAAAANAGAPAHTVTLPGLAPLRIRDLPSFLATTSEDDPYAAFLDEFRETLDAIERGEDGAHATGVKPTVLVNTFDALEPSALKSVDDLNLIAIGPVIPSLAALEGAAESKDLFAPDEKRYMEWLDGKVEGSVVYVSFGSMSVVKKRQMEEIRKGLKQSGRPYLWVVRKDNKEAESIEPEEQDQKGMVVSWCSQIRVLNHAAVGCFVTHCGWNSTVESVAAGCPRCACPSGRIRGRTRADAEEWGWGEGGDQWRGPAGGGGAEEVPGGGDGGGGERGADEEEGADVEGEGPGGHRGRRVLPAEPSGFCGPDRRPQLVTLTHSTS
ncbi:Crocetin glucosyltransferase, chloroplastic, partial [Ananas comosus]